MDNASVTAGPVAADRTVVEAQRATGMAFVGDSAACPAVLPAMAEAWINPLRSRDSPPPSKVAALPETSIRLSVSLPVLRIPPPLVLLPLLMVKPLMATLADAAETWKIWTIKSSQDRAFLAEQSATETRRWVPRGCRRVALIPFA